MLTTSRGSFSAVRSAVAGATGVGADSGGSDASAGTGAEAGSQSGTGTLAGTGESSGTGGWRHFIGANGQILGNGRWQFSLVPPPATVEWVDFDGALLYEGRTPGFSWDGSTELILSPPGGSLASDAELHVRTVSLVEEIA